MTDDTIPIHVEECCLAALKVRPVNRRGHVCAHICRRMCMQELSQRVETKLRRNRFHKVFDVPELLHFVAEYAHGGPRNFVK